MVSKAKKVARKVQMDTDARVSINARVEQALYERAKAWVRTNGLSMNQLVARALESYISEEHTLKPVPMPDKMFDALANKVIDKYASTLEKLK